MFTPLLSDHLWVFFPRWMICPCRFGGKNAITDGANLTGRGENTMRIHANKYGPQGWLCNRHMSELEIQNHCISDPWAWSVMSHGCQVQTHPALLCFEWYVLYFQTLTWSPHNLTAEHLKKLAHTTSTPFHPIPIATLWVLKYWNWYPGAPGFMDVHPPKIWFFHSFWMLLTHPQITHFIQFSQRDKVWVPTSSSCWSFSCLAAWKSLRGKSPRNRYEWREK